MKNTIKLLGIIALTVIIGLSFASCDDGNGKDDGGGGNIVNSTGQAWVSEDEGIGYVFRSDGTFDRISGDATYWDIDVSGKYSTEGDKLILTIQPSGSASTSYSINFSYSVTGNTLKTTISIAMYGMSRTVTFTKKSISIGVFIPPASTPLTNGTWANGSIDSSSSQKWYSFTVTAGTTYYVWWNDSYDGDGSKTADIEARAFSSDRMSIFSGDDAWSYPQSFVAAASGTVYIRVRSYSGTGTFAIAYSTSNTRP